MNRKRIFAVIGQIFGIECVPAVVIGSTNLTTLAKRTVVPKVKSELTVLYLLLISGESRHMGEIVLGSHHKIDPITTTLHLVSNTSTSGTWS